MDEWIECINIHINYFIIVQAASHELTFDFDLISV